MTAALLGILAQSTDELGDPVAQDQRQVLPSLQSLPSLLPLRAGGDRVGRRPREGQ